MLLVKANPIPNMISVGLFHKFSMQLKKSLIQTSRKGSVASRKRFDRALAKQQASRWRKEELAMEQRLKKIREEYIDAIYFSEMYKAPWCWDTVGKQNTNTTS